MPGLSCSRQGPGQYLACTPSPLPRCAVHGSPTPQTRAEAPGAVAVHHCVSLLCSLLHGTQRLPVLLRVGPQSSHPHQDQEGGQGPAG